MMSKFDFYSKSYSLAEIVEGYTDGSLDNFNGDEDFLEFLISYTLGNSIEGPAAEGFKEYAEYDGLLNIMLLDEYEMLGAKLYKIYETCNKDKMQFIRTLHHIGRTVSLYRFPQDLVKKNLSLTHPVTFVDDTVVLSDGTKPKYSFDNLPYYLYDDLSNTQKEEYYHELERSLRHRINESIKKNGDNLEPVEEILSYNEELRLQQDQLNEKKVNDDYEININNIYFGKETLDISGGMLGLHMGHVSWFEDTGIDILNYHIFRSIPEGDYCMLDAAGNIHIPKEVMSKNGISIGPSSPIRKVEITSIPEIFATTIQDLEEEPIENEESILQLNGLYELLERKQKLSVREMKNYESTIRSMYESTYGQLFKDNSASDTNEYQGGTTKK